MTAAINNLALQYTLVGILILGACVWILVKAFRKNKKRKSSGCCGCALQEACNKNKKENCEDNKSILN